MLLVTGRALQLRYLGFVVGIGVLAAIVGRHAVAQSTQKSQKIEVPAAERVLIETKDNVELRAQWYGGAGGKEAVPVILIHDWDSDRTALYPLAEYLQKKHGHAVIVPDLRGHGESLSVKGSDEELDRKRFKKAVLASMIEDIDSCRRFLQEKNDAGELNLDMLVVVACGKLSIHAANWCVTDWQWRPIGGVKQGQNVKALVLISPQRRFKSLQLTQTLKSRLFASKASALPLLLVWGENHEASSKDGESIYNSLKKSRSEPETFADQDERWAKQSLFRVIYKSDLVGERLLVEQGEKLFPGIALLIDKKIVGNKEDFLWQSREIK